MADENQPGAAPGSEQQFAIQRIYVKDLSFEAPMGANAFRQQWRPQINLDLNASNSPVDENIHEVVLTLTVTAKQDDETAFLVEVQQAGIFHCDGFDDQQIHQILGAVCPNILFPYARETIDSVVGKGSFPPLMLAPVNFDALYQQALERQQNTGGQSLN